MRRNMNKAKCIHCGRETTVGHDGRFVTHGPGRDTMTCKGSGKPAPTPKAESVKGAK